MLIENKQISLIYKLVLIALCVLGLVFGTGVLNGSFAFYVLFYYTTLSTLGCLIFTAASAVFTSLSMNRKGLAGQTKFAPHFKGGVVLAMLLNLFLFFAVILGSGGADPLRVIGIAILYFILPLMMLADWVLFDKKGRFGGTDPIIWLVVPLIYYAVVLVLAQAGMWYGSQNVHYPYAPINPDVWGWSRVLVNLFVLAIVHVAAGYVLFAADHFWGTRTKNKAMQEVRMLSEGEFFNETGEEGEKLYSLDELLSETLDPAPAAPHVYRAGQASGDGFTGNEKNLGATIAASAAAAAEAAYDAPDAQANTPAAPT